MTTKRTALITGATRGLGAETTRRLAELGWTIWLGARDAEVGRAVAEKMSDELGGADVRMVQLDVTSDESVAAAYGVVASSGTGLDVLVNNAGVSGWPAGASFEEAMAIAAPTKAMPDDFKWVFGVNLLGPVRVTNTFLPLLRTSSDPRLVMVSSGIGSFGVTTDPDRVESTLIGLVYPASKAALNFATSMYAKELPGVRVCAVDPGFTATDFNDHHGTQNLTEGTDAIVQACTAAELPGMFFNRQGLVPW